MTMATVYSTSTSITTSGPPPPPLLTNLLRCCNKPPHFIHNAIMLSVSLSLSLPYPVSALPQQNWKWWRAHPSPFGQMNKSLQITVHADNLWERLHISITNHTIRLLCPRFLTLAWLAGWLSVSPSAGWLADVAMNQSVQEGRMDGTGVSPSFLHPHRCWWSKLITVGGGGVIPEYSHWKTAFQLDNQPTNQSSRLVNWWMDGLPSAAYPVLWPEGLLLTEQRTPINKFTLFPVTPSPGGSVLMTGWLVGWWKLTVTSTRGH